MNWTRFTTPFAPYSTKLLLRFVYFPFISLLTGVFSSAAFGWQVNDTLPFRLSSNEEIIANQKNANQSTYYVVRYDTRQRRSQLRVVVPDGSSTKTITLDSAQIGAWQPAPEKGNVHQSFADAATVHAQKPGSYAPLEYRYQVAFSPDNQVALAYRYDYSQPVLYVRAKILDAQRQIVRTFQVPIDAGMTNHGLFVNNQQDVFILNTDAEDGIHVIRYDAETDTGRLLSVSASSTRRTGYTLRFGSGNRLFIANATQRDGTLTGIMYSVFNFADERVAAVNFAPLPPDLAEQTKKTAPPDFYGVQSFSVNPTGAARIGLEKRSIVGNDYAYTPFAVSTPDTWKPRKVRVQTGERIAFQFDATGTLTSAALLRGK